MSISVMNWAWSLKLPPTEKLILMSLADHSDDHGVCYPSQQRIADKCCVSRRTVIRILLDFEKRGILSTESRPGYGEGRKTNIYHINVEWQSDNLSHRGNVTSVQGKVTPVSHKPSVEPSVLLKESRRKNFTEEDSRLAVWIFDQILLLNPKHKKPNFDTWADEIRLMRERDNHTHREIAELFKWANRDDFWKTNILSPKTLRKQWDKLTIQKGHRNETRTRNSDKGTCGVALDNIFGLDTAGHEAHSTPVHEVHSDVWQHLGFTDEGFADGEIDVSRMDGRFTRLQ